MRYFPLVLLCVICGGCTPTFQDTPPDGYRNEYKHLGKKPDGSPDYVKTRDNELHAASAPTRVPVYQTRPGPETGPYRHDPLSTEFIGTEKKDAPAMWQIMNMTPPASASRRPAVSPQPSPTGPTARYITNDNAKKRHNSRPAEKRPDTLGFRKDGPEWLREDYTGMTAEQEALAQKAQKKAKAKKEW